MCHHHEGVYYMYMLRVYTYRFFEEVCANPEPNQRANLEDELHD